MKIHILLLVLTVEGVFPEDPISHLIPPSPLSALTQQITKWLWPQQKLGQQQTGEEQTYPHYTNHEGVGEERGGKQTKASRCSPCNSVPWIPVAGGVNSVPATYSDKGQHYSFQVPTIGIAALPILTNQYGPPNPAFGHQPAVRPEYGPPKPGYGPPPKPEYGPPPRPDYGPSHPKPEYGPPPQKPEYGPPPPPPIPEYGPPPSKPEYGPPPPPPKPDYGPPPKPEYGPPPPKPEYGPPPQNPNNGSPSLKPEYGPPQPEYGFPKPEYGPPNSGDGQTKPADPEPQPGNLQIDIVPPKTEYGSPPQIQGFFKPESHYGPPQQVSDTLKAGLHYPNPEYSSPNIQHGSPNGQAYLPPSGGKNPGQEYLPPQSFLSSQPNNYGPPNRQPNHNFPRPNSGPPKLPFLMNKPLKPFGLLPIPFKSNYSPNKPVFGQPNSNYSPSKPINAESNLSNLKIPGSSFQAQSTRQPQDLSYMYYLSPPPQKGGQYVSMKEPVPFPELSFHPLPPIHDPQPFGATLRPQPPKSHPNVIVTIQETDDPSCSKCPPTGPNLGQSGPEVEPAKNEVANFGNLPLSDSAHEASSVTLAHNPSTPAYPLQSNQQTQVHVMKSVPIADFLSSVEYPMQIIQAPLLDVPGLNHYVDLGYHSFNQHALAQYQDSEKASSFNKPVTSNVNIIPRDPKLHRPTDEMRQAALISPDGVLKGIDFNKNSTIYEAERVERPDWDDIRYQSTPQPFAHQTSSTTRPKQVHQVIIPYIRTPPIARKVPPTTEPDISAIYVNRAVTAPDNTHTTNINYPLTATGSENLETLRVPEMINSLPPDVMSKLVELGFSPAGAQQGQLQHVIATDIRALLHGEEDSVDLSRLQKNIDKWTVEGYGKREIIPKQNSKVIPEDYFTTQAPEEGTKEDEDHEMAASQNIAVTFKVPHQKKSEENETVLVHEVNGWSLSETKVKAVTEEPTTTGRPWEQLEVSISPQTQEKVYVVTPMSTWPSDPVNTTAAVPSIAPPVIVVSSSEQHETSNLREAETKSTETKYSSDREMAASVTYLGTAGNMKPKISAPLNSTHTSNQAH